MIWSKNVFFGLEYFFVVLETLHLGEKDLFYAINHLKLIDEKDISCNCATIKDSLSQIVTSGYDIYYGISINFYRKYLFVFRLITAIISFSSLILLLLLSTFLL